jgi:hypothetical protein
MTSLRGVRRWKYAAGVVALVAVIALTTALCSVWAQEADPLGAMIAKSGLKFRELEKGSWVVPFDAGEGKTMDVYVTYNNEKKKFAMIFTTVVDKEDNYAFSKEILLEAMKLNNDYPACKFCLDAANGDIDCQSEVYMATLTPESLDMHINLVAALADENSKKLNELAR